MLEFFRSDPFGDARLGTFTRRGGHWVGTCSLPPHGTVALRVGGSRKAPDPEALELAASLADQYARLKPQVAAALFGHYEPGREAWTSGALEGVLDAYPELKGPDDVWANVRSVLVDIDPSRRAFPVEVRLEVTWDEEHTLGVRLRDGQLIELCGSTGP